MTPEVMDVLNPVLDGAETSAVLSKGLASPHEITEVLEGMGYAYEMETNGWQWDFWIQFSRNGEPKFQLSGDGYYGKTMTFSIYEQ